MKIDSPQHFSVRLKRFLKCIVKQRVYLIESGKGRLPDGSMRAAVDRLMPYLSMNFTDHGAAIFLAKHQHDIRAIIPSNNAKANQLAHLDVLIEASKIITSKTYSNAH